MADVTINELTPGTPSGAAVVPYSEGGITKSTTIANFGVPIGTVFHLATSTVPMGYLKCNGDVVPNGSGTVQGVTANFSALHTTLGTTYGTAGKLPDLRGEFVRGFDDGRGIDTSRVMGSSQLDQFQGHYHAKSTAGIQGGTASLGANPGGNIYAGYNAEIRQPITDGTNDVPRIGSETRPRNVALMPVIKY